MSEEILCPLEEFCRIDDICRLNIVDPFIAGGTKTSKSINTNLFKPCSDAQSLQEHVTNGTIENILIDHFPMTNNISKQIFAAQIKMYRDFMVDPKFRLYEKEFKAPEPLKQLKIVANVEMEMNLQLNTLCARFMPDQDPKSGKYKNHYSYVHGENDALGLMLGPASLINHDCISNTEYILTSPNITSVQVLAKNIAFGEEITVYYSSDYFGHENEGCQCDSCDKGNTVMMVRSPVGNEIKKFKWYSKKLTTLIDAIVNEIESLKFQIGEAIDDAKKLEIDEYYGVVGICDLTTLQIIHWI
ncbi:histone-lysine N-methyltransferase KMT5B-like [Contarinia nasturtii]|uniref:histone-lysine N-methyltransferase KMT5B-like n=1 Tax=Contarinia nasturtii TaxID=265458 RepID=UPI0012D3E2A2|nr:histone-lysine N-methyltransferase KMT5B-like [Contarinia nasturtii]